MAAPLDLLMPKLGLTMTEGTVVQWAVEEGTKFTCGAILVTIETDKIASDVEASADGTMGPILAGVGSVVKVGTPIAHWRPDLLVEDLGKLVTRRVVSTADRLPPEPRRSQVPMPDRTRNAGQRVVATPFARRLARAAGLDLATIEGTGPNGRINAVDVEGATAVHLVIGDAAAAERPTHPGSVHPSVASIDVAADGIVELSKRLGRTEIDQLDWIILALGRCGVDCVGIAGLCVESGVDVVNLPERLSIGKVGALRRASHAGTAPAGEVAIAIFVARDGIHSFVPSPPYAWRHAMGISAVRPRQHHPPVLTLGLNYDCALMDHAKAHGLLVGMRDLLEEPLSLLAG